LGDQAKKTDLNFKYSLARRVSWVGHVAHVGEKRNAYRILLGKPEGKRPLRRQTVDGEVMLKWV
jgi:hypothetical protein